MKTKYCVILLAFLLILPTMWGCDGRPKRLPVTGQVTLEGQPVDYGTNFQGMNSVKFIPKSGGRAAYAQMDSQGKFAIGNYEAADGIPLGEYDVEVIIRRSEGDPKKQSLIPEKYENRKTSGLSITIAKDTKEITINLEK